MGSGLKVTVFAPKTAKTIGNITIDGIRYHINKMKKENWLELILSFRSFMRPSHTCQQQFAK